VSVTCVIADDHPPVVQFLSRYLSGRGVTVTASTTDGNEALQKIEQTRPAVALLDMHMPQLSGIDVARRLTQDRSRTRVLLYTGRVDRALLNDALDAGVGGMIEKDAPLDDVLRAIQVVAGGGMYIDPRVTSVALEQQHRPRTLTPRERDVLRLLADGHSNEQIGAALSISPQTVRTHVQKAMQKLDARTRVQAVATALRESLIS
jgi:DNA-binding NarL/FixJ family response regulator